MSGLEQYRRKRDFERTPEPEGDRRGVGERDEGVFVVHEHHARNLHYDLRLEHDGVLQSWAVPKGPSREKGEKRLAIRVEDHPLEYGDFEGVIPEGEYGGGTIMLWDRGTWHPTRRTRGRIDFELRGSKLRGTWTLTRMREDDQWLLIKRGEDGGPPSVPDDRSVATGRTVEQIARGDLPRRPAIEGARQGPLPRDPRPQLATRVDRPSSGDGWLHEIKFDGYRILARVDEDSVRLISRNGKDWTDRFPEIARRLADLPPALLDGEMVALTSDGTSSFRRLQEALATRRTGDLVYHVFDLLHLDGLDLRPVALRDRKRALADLITPIADPHVRYTDHLQGRGPEFFERACRLGLEGVVSKRAEAEYRPGRHRGWTKAKCVRDDEFVVGGYTRPSGARRHFGALLLGTHDEEGRLRYAGKVGTGFGEAQLRSLGERLHELERGRSPFIDPPSARGVRWVEPELVVRVEFTEWTREGRLRHPVFQGLREDKDPGEVRAVPTNAAQDTTDGGSDDRVAGVRLTHPERVLFPEQGATKLALARYYEEIADWILPHLAGRPLVLLRCPQGHGAECFFQKHPGPAVAKSIPRVTIAEKDGDARYVVVEELRDLIGLVQTGALEFHVWGSRADDVERPERIVLDLDPGEAVAWSTVIDTARALRDRMGDLGFESFVRTTGGKGLHVVVPLRPHAEWSEVKDFARAVCEAHARDDPGHTTTNMSKEKRHGRIFLDYLRNGRGATAIAPYSTRARAGAPVAVPVRWDELNDAMRGDRYHLDNVRRRLAALSGDPWQEFEEARRPLTPDRLDAVKDGSS